jgi:GntR family transcriptional regulator
VSIREAVGSLQRSDPTPLYLQLQKVLRGAINEKVVAAEDAIPTERELADDFSVSRITVRKAVQGLVAEGLLTRRHGAGTFVTGTRVDTRVAKSFSKLSSFSEDMRARGRKPSSTWLNKAAGFVNPVESLSLGLSPGSVIYRFHRIRFADSVSMAIEYSTIPGYSLSSESAVEDSLYAALDISGFRPVRALQRVRAIVFNAEQANILSIETGAPGLFIERCGFLEDGRAAEFTQSYYRGDSYDLVAEL